MRYLNNMMSPNALMERTWGAIVVGVIGAGVSLHSASKNRDLAEGQATDAETARKKAQAQLEKEKAAYRNMKITNQYSNMENPYEDLTVNQQQAQFQGQQMDAQRANIMRGLKGAAGASGIASLAQAMANQGQLQTQRISASIGQQESRNQMLLARGAAAADMAERGGEQWVQAAEMDKSATLLSMSYGEATMQEAEMSRQSTLLGVDFAGLAGANASLQQAYANQSAGMATAAQMTQDRWNTASNLYGDYTKYKDSIG